VNNPRRSPLPRRSRLNLCRYRRRDPPFNCGVEWARCFAPGDY
jgi:hypothetical protein